MTDLELVLNDLALELGCPPDNEQMLLSIAKLRRDRQAMSECLYHIIREEFENGTEGDRMRGMSRCARTCFELIEWMDNGSPC